MKMYTPWSQDIMYILYTSDRGKEKYAHIYLLNSYIPFTDKPMQYLSSTIHIIAFWDVQAFSLPSRKHLTQYNVNRKRNFLYFYSPPPGPAKLFEEKLFLKSQQSLWYYPDWAVSSKIVWGGGSFFPPMILPLEWVELSSYMSLAQLFKASS